MPPQVKRMFVLMMENRSYDNLFGYSNFSGWTPAGAATKANGLVGKPPYANKDGNGQLHAVASGAPFRLKFDPGHEFSDVLVQAYGVGSVSPYECTSDTATAAKVNGCKPVIDPDSLGFAYDLAAHQQDVASALRCFSPDQLPVLNFLAHQFAVCDNWFSSMPGPTWPNRFFALAGTSWGLDHSPTTWEVIDADVFDGHTFGNGCDTLFTQLPPEQWLITYGDTPQSWALTGVRANRHNFIQHADLWDKLQTGTLGDANFIFIEPNYDPGLGSKFTNGDSMHPQGDVRKGEALIEKMYNAIKESIYWDECVFLIVFDEHGGFFDHAIPTGDVIPEKNVLTPTAPTALTQRGFQFDRYGFRVPAIVISPFVRQSTIDHAFYDHVSIAKTLNLIVNRQNPPLLDTPRYVQADDFGKILTLTNPRSREDIPPCPPALPLNEATPPPDSNRTAQAFARLGWEG